MNSHGQSNTFEPKGQPRFWRVWISIFCFGLLGIFALARSIYDQLELLPPELADMPVPLTIGISLINPLILLAAAAAVGTGTAHRVGLRSLTAEKIRSSSPVWPEFRSAIPRALIIGLIYTIVLVVLDYAINPFSDADFLADPAEHISLVIQLLVGIFYGGITEEILLRWGFMSMFLWIGWRIIYKGRGAPSPGLVWTAIIVAALIFGIGHLPAMASLVQLTPLIVFRTILLNALGGILFGWFFWKHNLETAMLSHASVHVYIFFLRIAGII